MNYIREHTHLAETLAKWGPLTYVSTSPDCSTYLNRDGDEVWLHHGSAISLDYFDDVGWSDRYDDWLVTHGRSLASSRAFLEKLKGLVIDPDEIEQLLICEDCYDVKHGDDTYGTGHETRVCDGCWEDYWFCHHCEESYRSTNTIGDREVCSYCTDEHYSYCDHCEDYYDSDNGGHDHDRSACCVSPAMQFRVRNNGDGWLANDTRTRVGLPAGYITEEGVAQIAQAIRDWAQANVWIPNAEYEANKEWHEWANISYRLEEVGLQWQTKRGNFTKRLSRFAHTEHNLKMHPDLVSQIGNIARVHSDGVDFDVEVTRNLNLPREDFAHSGSCWWSEYAGSRCALKTNGGFGLRSFVPGSGHSDSSTVTGRAWVIPLRRIEGTDSLVETFDTENPDAFVVFNGYGVLNNYTPSRVVAHMYGWTYRKIEFTCDEMYINDDNGYLVAPEELAEQYTDGSLDLDLEDHANLYETERARAHSQSTENCSHFEVCSHNEREHAHV